MTGDLSDGLIQIWLSLPRVLAAFFMLPIFAPQIVPPLIRLGLAMPFAIFIAAVGVVGDPPRDWIGLLLLTSKEALLGLLIGFVWALPLHAVQSVGEIIDFQTGSTTTQAMDPFSGNETSVTANLLAQILMVLFVSVGGLALFFDSLVASYRAWPVDVVWPSFGVDPVRTLLFESNSLFSLALLLAAPVVLVLLLVDFAFGVMNKTAPALHVLEISQTIKGWISIALLLLMLPFLIERLVTLLPSLGGLVMRLLSAP